MQQPHVDAAGSLLVAAKLIGLLDNFIVCNVYFFTCLSMTRGTYPCVIPGSGNSGYTAQRTNVQPIVFSRNSFMDKGEFHFCRCLDSHCLCASIFAACSFFKNSTSCRV